MPMDHEIKETRQQAILEILPNERVTSQLELVDLLRQRGISATQSSVSRDLRELGVAWIGGRYALPQEREGRDPGLAEFSRFLRGVKPAGPHLTVIFTAVGTAQSVGLAIDRAGWPEVVGTMAGDDTVFAATASARDQKRLIQRLDSFLER
ncbi:MAG TPA: arginine repressor [Thermoanaerobaculia bacterium]|nr:arginine repressor [Thermoanaerobaculia bacterium]